MLCIATVSCCSVLLKGDYKCVKITFGIPEAELILLSEFFSLFAGLGLPLP